jgi:hypothetical protein
MPDSSSGPLSRRVLPLLGLLPALVAPWLIYAWMKDCLLNVPFMDDYVWLHLYEKIHAGTFNWWNDTFFVQMEHRLNLPAIWATLCYKLKPGHITLHNWISFGEICVTGFNLLFLLKRTYPDLKHRWFVGALVIWVLFSPVQAYTLLWSDCFSSYVPAFFLSSALAIYISRLPCWVRMPLCLLCAVLASVGFAAGLLIWPLMAVMIAGSDKLSNRVRWGALIVWLLIFAIFLKLYFTNLVNQAEPAFSYEQGHEKTLGKQEQLAAFLGNPWRSTSFVFMFAGAFIGRGTFAGLQEMSFFLGMTLTILLAAFGVVALNAQFRKKEPGVLSSSLPWLVFGLYTLGAGAMVALGREYSRKTLISALWARYTNHAAPLVIAVVVLSFVWWQRWMAAKPDASSRLRLRPLGPVFAGVFAMLVIGGWIYGQNFMEAWQSSRLRDATCQEFAKLPAPFEARPPLTKNLDLAVRMDNIGGLIPPMSTSPQLDQFQIKGAASGKIEDFDLNTSGTFSVKGYAYIHGQARQADGIILSWKDPDKGQTMFALGQVTAPPLYLRGVLEADLQYLYQPSASTQHNFAFFEVSFDKTVLPPGRTVEISAWAFDFLQQSVYSIAGQFRVNATTGQVDLIKEEKNGK